MTDYYDMLKAQEKRIFQLKKGEVGYIYPWALTVSSFGITVDMECECFPVKFGTSCVRVQRTYDNQLAIQLSRWAFNHLNEIGLLVEEDIMPTGIEKEYD